MAGRIRDEDVSYVRDHTAIDDVVGEYVQLKNAGGGQKKGLCPFHDEKSPSFNVTPSKGYFHCFGCGVGGDVIAFVMKVDHQSFSETVERLADRLGYQLRYDSTGSTPENTGPKKSRLYAANAAAAEFYQSNLLTPAAAHGREFLTKRGFDKTSCELFGVGYAPDEWDGLYKYLRSKAFTDEELAVAGLTKEGTKGPIDRFRNRLIWPIKDITGEYVGFGARKLASDDVDQGPKYLNTSETPIYKKSRILYGLEKAKKDISQKRQVVVVEGYTDVMAAHLAGVTTAVATCGTAFGDEHIGIIRRLLMDDDSFRGEVIFTFDGDAAGQKAALKAFGDDQKFVTQTFVAVEPNGMDPCELRIASGDSAVRDLIARRVPLFEFAMKSEIAKYDITTAEGRVLALNAVAPLVGKIKDASLRPEYSKAIAGWLGMDMDIVSAAVKKSLHFAKAAPTPQLTQPAEEVNLRDPILLLEREVLKVKLQAPELVKNWNEIEANAFSYWAYHALRTHVDNNPNLEIAQLIEKAEAEDVRSLITQLLVEPVRLDGEISNRYTTGLVARLREVALSRSIADLKSTLQRLNPTENVEEYNQAFASLIALEAQKTIQKEISAGEL
jgi:DNA primase